MDKKTRANGSISRPTIKIILLDYAKSGCIRKTARNLNLVPAEVSIIVSKNKQYLALLCDITKIKIGSIVKTLFDGDFYIGKVVRISPHGYIDVAVNEVQRQAKNGRNTYKLDKPYKQCFWLDDVRKVGA